MAIELISNRDGRANHPYVRGYAKLDKDYEHSGWDRGYGPQYRNHLSDQMLLKDLQLFSAI
jgi:hypothetical protein